MPASESASADDEHVSVVEVAVAAAMAELTGMPVGFSDNLAGG